jgi:hypothetical protein
MRYMMLVRSVAPRDRRLHRSSKRWARWQLNPRKAENSSEAASSAADRRPLGTRGAHPRLSLFSTLEIPRFRAGSLDALPCKFGLPSVPLRAGGIGSHIGFTSEAEKETL